VATQVHAPVVDLLAADLHVPRERRQRGGRAVRRGARPRRPAPRRGHPARRVRPRAAHGRGVHAPARARRARRRRRSAQRRRAAGEGGVRVGAAADPVDAPARRMPRRGSNLNLTPSTRSAQPATQAFVRARCRHRASSTSSRRGSPCAPSRPSAPSCRSSSTTASAAQHGQSRRLGEAMAGLHGLIRLHLEAWGWPSDS